MPCFRFVFGLHPLCLLVGDFQHEEIFICGARKASRQIRRVEVHLVDDFVILDLARITLHRLVNVIRPAVSGARYTIMILNVLGNISVGLILISRFVSFGRNAADRWPRRVPVRGVSKNS
ncbi:hypothetical protein D3C84_983450 [compost metagenome]